MNRLLLSAAVLERSALRYTPAALPVLDLVLRHESQLSEAGTPRKLAMELKAVAIGDISGDLQRLAMGQEACFSGFLANARNGKGVLFHITALVSSTDPASPS